MDIVPRSGMRSREDIVLERMTAHGMRQYRAIVLLTLVLVSFGVVFRNEAVSQLVLFQTIFVLPLSNWSIVSAANRGSCLNNSAFGGFRRLLFKLQVSRVLGPLEITNLRPCGPPIWSRLVSAPKAPPAVPLLEPRVGGIATAATGLPACVKAGD